MIAVGHEGAAGQLLAGCGALKLRTRALEREAGEMRSIELGFAVVEGIESPRSMVEENGVEDAIESPTGEESNVVVGDDVEENWDDEEASAAGSLSSGLSLGSSLGVSLGSSSVAGCACAGGASCVVSGVSPFVASAFASSGFASGASSFTPNFPQKSVPNCNSSVQGRWVSLMVPKCFWTIAYSFDLLCCSL